MTETNNEKHMPNPRNGQPNYTFALIVMFVVCFLIGFVTTMNNSMIAFCTEAFNLNAGQGQLVNTAFYGAYLFSIPLAFMMNKIGYKRTLILGLVVVAVGFVINSFGIKTAIAAQANVYAVFLGSMCLVAIGIVMLQNVTNPYVMVLGSKGSGAFRMTLSQALNSVATTVAPLFIAAVIIGGKTATPAAVPGPYLGIGIFVAVIALILAFLSLPKIDEGKQDEAESVESIQYKGSAFAYPHVWLGALGIFMYMGVEIGVPSMLPYRISALEGVEDGTALATKLLAFYWGGMMVGRFIGAAILTRFKPRNVLVFCLSMGALCILSSIIMGNNMLGIWLMLAAGLFHSVMWPLIFNLGLQDLGPNTKQATGIINTGVIGAAVLMPVLGRIVDVLNGNARIAMVCLFVFYAYIIWFAVRGSRIGLSKK